MFLKSVLHDFDSGQKEKEDTPSGGNAVVKIWL